MPASLSSPPAPPFTRSTRDERVASLGDQEFDVVVIGGGITGAGIVRDAALRGLRVAQFETKDLAAGTSSASSKLVHGGLRYLEQRKVGLVVESVTERARLEILAPHLVRPMPFVFPVYGKKPRPLWMVGLGLWIYEVLALFRVPRRHETLGRRAAAETFPYLNTDALDGGVLYWDCATDDARLVLETAISAHEGGAWILPRTRVTGFLTERTHIQGVTVRDELTGAEHTVRSRVVVNATGPWTDRTLGLRRQQARMMRPTKGTHIVLKRDRLPIEATIMLWTGGDGFIFAIPADERVFVGTTDSDYSGDYDAVRATGDEVGFFLEQLNHSFPGAALTADDVLGTWAGLRPLLAAAEDEDTREVSREHTVRFDDDGLITIAGGKLTTYRLMAAEVVDAVAERLRGEGLHVGRCPTGAVLLPGAAGVERRKGVLRSMGKEGRALEDAARAEFGDDVLDHLLRTYGGRWPRVVERARADERLGQRIDAELPYLWAEVDHAVEEEMAMTVEDVLRRRTQVMLRADDLGLAAAPDVAARMAHHLGWSREEIGRQLDAYEDAVRLAIAWRDELA
mgnify:CR=1 FL=1